MCPQEDEQWNSAVDSWVDFVRNGKDYSREFMNNPAMFRMLGNVKEKYILDLCCGEGYNSRIMAKKGAKVVGGLVAKLDVPQEMVVVQ